MRLDHLLSKEHWPPRRSRAWSWTNASRQVLKGGTSISWRRRDVRRPSTGPRAVERADTASRRLARCWVLRARAKARPSGVGLRPAWTPPNDEPPPLAEGVDSKVGCRPYVENYTVDASIFVAQVFKGARWMPWHQEPKKDVGICDKPRGVDNQTVIRGFPNGETRLEASPVTPA